MPYPRLLYQKGQPYSTTPTGGDLTTEGLYSLTSAQSPWIPMECLIWDGTTSLRPYIIDWISGYKNKPPNNLYTFYRAFCPETNPPSYNIYTTRNSGSNEVINGPLAPVAGLGITGDYYLNGITQRLYRKTGASTWTELGSLSNSMSTNYFIGTIDPVNTFGSSGTTYYNQRNKTLFYKATSSYSVVGYVLDWDNSKDSCLADDVITLIIEQPTIKYYNFMVLPYKVKITKTLYKTESGLATIELLAPTVLESRSVSTSLTSFNVSYVIPADTMIRISVTSVTDGLDLFIQLMLERV